MSKGSSSSGTTRIEPPAYQLPYLQSGLARADEQYNRTNGGANAVAGFSPYQLMGQGNTVNRAISGDPTIRGAQNYVQNSLNGGFLNSNPYLDQTFNRAAMATQGQLASQFAGAGRNVDQSQGNRAQQLNDLASQIYGGNYANERQLQQGALGYAQPLGNQAYADANALMGVGQQQQDMSQRMIDAPGNVLDQYLARIRGTDYGSSQKQSGGGGLSGSGALGGALAGLKLGSAFPIIGPTVGAIGGGLLGLFG